MNEMIPPPDLVIIGHSAFNKDITPHSSKTSIGGAAYYASVGAYMSGGHFGVVTNLGYDFNRSVYESLNADTKGINVFKNLKSAHFTITQEANGQRKFAASWGAAAKVEFYAFDPFYYNCSHIHLATASPEQQKIWINYIRKHSPQSIISIDVFEAFCKSLTNQTIKAIGLADMIFMNEEERQLLNLDINSLPNKHIILKMGSKGALYKYQEEVLVINAPTVIPVDTTGAGDILAGAFLSLINKTSKSIALSKAVQLASRSVTQFGVDHLLH